MFFRHIVPSLLAVALFLAVAVPEAAGGEVVDIEAGPIWSDEHARERCPEVAGEWTAENPGLRAAWTGRWTTTVEGEMSVCACEIVAENVEPVREIETREEDEVGRDLRTRRGYSHAWINESEDVSVLYFFFDNGVLAFYRDEPGMGHVFKLDLSGLPAAGEMIDDIVFEDIDDDGYADMRIPLPGGRSAAWRWNADDWTFEAAGGARLPAPAATRKTLAALPAWTAPRLVVHIGELSDIASRLGSSWLLDFALDIRPERKALLEWLNSFPMESFSLVRGLSRDDEDTFHGAIRFNDDRADVLARLEELPLPDDDDEAEAELQALLYRLSGIPNVLVHGEGIRFQADFVEERKNLYSISGVSGLFDQWLTLHDVFVSVADGGGEKLLLVASSPEGIERARNALGDESARLEIARRNPEKANFVQIADDASGSGTDDMLDNMYWIEPKAPAGLELSLGLSDDAIELSLWHTFFNVLLGDSFRPKGAWRADDAGFAFGGGNPWLAGAFSPGLDEKDFLDLLIFLAHGDDDQVRDMFKEIGVDLSTLSGAFRSIGLVLGGNASLCGEPAPGGYVFVSGDAEKMRTLLPIVTLLLNSRLSHSFEAVDREGWDVFYAVNDEYRERAGGMPWYAGVKDGVLMMGILADDDLETEPYIDWPEGGGDGSLLLAGSLDFSLFVERCGKFIDAIPLPKAYEAAGAVDLEDLFEPEVWIAAFRFFALAQEIERVTLVMPESNRLDLTIHTTWVDYENVWELMRTSRMLAAEE